MNDRKDLSKLNLETDGDILNHLYGGDGKNLDKQELFLRNYILNEGWRDKNKDGNEDHYSKYQDKLNKIDEEDSERDLEMDLYEHEHNFRFEEKNAAYLTTHARQAPEDSMRRADDKRKQQRETVKERKEQEKLQRKEEINKLKALKRDEIMNKLKQTEFIAGISKKNSIFENKKLLEKAEKELNTEFIPDLYDKAMDALFGENFYQASDDDGEDLEAQKDIDMQLLNDKNLDQIGQLDDEEVAAEHSDVDEEEFIERQKASRQQKFEGTLAKSLKEQVEKQEEASGFETWYACDGCYQAIGSG